MNRRRAIERLRSIVAQDLDSLAPNTILPDGDGYLVFEIYSLQPDGDCWRVYKRRDLVNTMTSIKTAVSWCVADKYRQYNLGMQIQELDRQKLMIESDLRTRAHLGRRVKSGIAAEAIESKLDARRRRLQAVDERLAKCVNVAKYWQLRGFNNETARTGRTASHRTYRQNT